MSPPRIPAALSMLITIVVLSPSCKSEDSAQGEAPSCDVAAERLIELCGAYPGEDFRALCETQGTPFVTAEHRRCASELEVCDEASFERCDIRSVVIGCSDGDCPAPLLCEPENLECVRCLADDDCTSGRGCWMGLCYNMDSAFYQAVRGAADAGGP